MVVGQTGENAYIRLAVGCIAAADFHRNERRKEIR
jgi:hypothetical protein